MIEVLNERAFVASWKFKGGPDAVSIAEQNFADLQTTIAGSDKNS